MKYAALFLYGVRVSVFVCVCVCAFIARHCFALAAHAHATSMEHRLKKLPSGFDEDYLFQAPNDLVCPITHELFRDPVLNSAGRMYEREAFLQYLESTSNPVDPISREPLRADVLTPVVQTRGSAIEYRENVSRVCVEIACGGDCQQPIKYLRRAADLCSGVNLQVRRGTCSWLMVVNCHIDVLTLKWYCAMEEAGPGDCVYVCVLENCFGGDGVKDVMSCREGVGGLGLESSCAGKGPGGVGMVVWMEGKRSFLCKKVGWLLRKMPQVLHLGCCSTLERSMALGNGTDTMDGFECKNWSSIVEFHGGVFAS